MTERPILPLTQAAFAPFGDVIEAGSESELINAGTTAKYADLARLSLTEAEGRPGVALYRAEPVQLPHRVELLERHPLSSQLFMPLADTRMVVIVAPPGDAPDPDALRAFVTYGLQGVNYHPGVWHHPSIVMDRSGWLLVVDRIAADENCDLHHFSTEHQPRVVLPHTPSAGEHPS